jgi:hypothetical protein
MIDDKLNIINSFLKKQKKLILLNGEKTPITKGWNTKHISKEKLIKHNKNLGWALGETDLVIDIDPKGTGHKHDGDKSWSLLQGAFGSLRDLLPTVRTPSGGRHYYLRIPKDTRIKGKLKGYDGIDFLSARRYCVIPPSLIKKTSYTWCDISGFKQTDAPSELLDLLVRDTYDKSTNTSGIGDFEGLLPKDCSEQRVFSALGMLDPCMDYDKWVKIGMCLHDWDTYDGFDLWDEWSKECFEKYDPSLVMAKWKSFRPGKGVSINTLFFEASEMQEKYISNTIGEINSCDNIDEIANEIMDEIKNSYLTNENKAKIAGAITKRLGKLGADNIPTNKAMTKMLTLNPENDFQWCEDWVYIVKHSSYFNKRTYKSYNPTGFNITNGQHIIGKTLPANFVINRSLIDVVDGMAYLPQMRTGAHTIDGLQVMNCFNPASIPKPSKSYQHGDIEYIEFFKKHIRFICSEDEEKSHILMHWLIHQAQHPGRKILWAPLIQGIEGIGKSYFGAVLNTFLGDANVGVVSPEAVKTVFNGWATGICVNILEELMISGNNRYNIVEAIKPLITNPYIQINNKGISQYKVLNTTNYIAFTNHRDAIPLGRSDRRWWVIFAPIQDKSEFVKFVGEEHSIYFVKLFNGLKTHGSGLLKWALEYELPSEFLKIREAPISQYKYSIIINEEAKVEGLSEIKDLINTGSKYFNNDAVSTGDLFNELKMECDLYLTNIQKHNLMIRLGYSKYGKMKMYGVLKTMYTKKIMMVSPTNNQIIRDLLDGTKPTLGMWE